MPTVSSPFRYPGGKSRLAGRIIDLLAGQSRPLSHYVEPFVGGGAVALLVAVRYPGITLHLNDADPRVAAFWTAMSQADDSAYEKLVRRAETAVPSVDLWRSEKAAGFDGSLDDLAFRALFLNRCTFSGNMSLTSGGPIGGHNQTGKWKIDARWKMHLLLPSLERTRDLLSSRSTVVTAGSWENVRQIRGWHYYDPPYMTDDRGLYSTMFSVDDHISLRTHLRACRSPWVLSYDHDHGDHIAWMYRFAQRETVDHISRVQQGQSVGSKRTEVLFTPHPRPVKRRYGTSSLPS